MGHVGEGGRVTWEEGILPSKTFSVSSIASPHFCEVTAECFWLKRPVRNSKMQSPLSQSPGDPY